MTQRSHAQQMLVSLYQKVLRRRFSARPRMEALPRRVLFSGSNLPPVNSVPPAQTGVEDAPLVFSNANGNAISVTDDRSSTLRVALSVTSGGLTLAATSGLSFTTGDGNADAAMTFTGTISAINNALNGLTFAKSANVAGTATLTIVSDDLDSSGSGGNTKTDTDTVAITLSAVNDPPTLTLPPTQSVAEDTPLTFSSAGGNAIAAADIDAGTQSVQMSLSVTSGTLTLASVAGLTFLSGDGAADANLVFSGDLTAINAALNGLTFVPAADFSGAVTLAANFNDLGSSGVGGPLGASGSVMINVAAINDAPLNIMPPSQSVPGGGVLNLGGAYAAALAIADVDAGANDVQLTLNASTGTMTLATTAGLTFTNGDGTADSLLTFRGTVDAINNALNGMTYNPPLILLGSASIDITTYDFGNSGAGGVKQDSDTLIVSGAAPTNFAPTITAPTTQASNEDSPLLFASVFSNGITVDDPDAGGGAIQITLTASNGRISLANTSGLTFSTGDGADDSTVTFTATLADANNALSGLAFTPTANFSGSAALAITVDDQGNSGAGGSKSDSAAIAITVNAVNDGPVNNIPAPQATPEDQNVVFSAANANAIFVTDADAGSASLQVTLTGDDGAITLATTSGLTFTTGDGSGDTIMTFTGALAGINAALNGLTFAPAANFNGTATLHISTSDLGNTGSGGALVDFNHVNIAVAAINDAPVNNVPPAAPSMLEDGTLLFSGSSISITDVDADPGFLQVALSSLDGTMTLAQTAGLTFTIGDGAADADMTFTGILADINAALDGLAFTPGANFNGIAGIGITTNDQGNSGGAALSDTDGFSITVSAVNDPPVVVINTGLTAAEGSAAAISPAQLRLDDVDHAAAQITLTLSVAPAHGALTLDDTVLDAGDSFTQADIDSGRVSFQPANDGATADWFSFTASDSAGGTLGPVTVAIQITLADDPAVPPPSPPPPIDPPPPAIDDPLPPTPTPPPISGEDVDDAIVATDRSDDAVTTIQPLSTFTGPAPRVGRGDSPIAAPPPPAPPNAPAPDAVAPQEERPEPQKVQTQPLATETDAAAVPPTDSTVAAVAPSVGIAQPVPPQIAPTPEQLKIAAQQVAFVSAAKTELADQLDTMREDVTSEGRAVRFVAGSAGFISVGMSIIYLFWTIRGGYLLASLLSSMPAWKLVDPLPILDHFDEEQRRRKARDDNDDDDNESLQSLAEGHRSLA